LEGSPAPFDFMRHAIDSTRQVVSSPLKAEDLPDTEWPTRAVVILRGARPFQEPQVDRLDRFLKAGGAAWLLLNGSAEQQAWLKNQGLEVTLVPPPGDDAPLHLRNWDIDHPLLAPLGEASLMALLNIDFYHGFAIKGLNATPVATWEDGTTALAEINSKGERFLVSGFDLDRETTNWPLQASFVPFVHSTALWLLQQKPSSEDWRVGDSIPLASEGTWEGLDTSRPQPPLHVLGSARPTVPGIYRFVSKGQTDLYAVNVKSEESDPAAWPHPENFNSLSKNASHRGEARRTTTALSEEQAENRQRIWWWLMLAVLLFLLLELPLANRTTP
jgi:hypothetical protein